MRKRDALGRWVKRTIEDWEAEAQHIDGCLIHPNKGGWTARLCYRLRHGSTPKGFFVCHKCDTPECINDEHHFLGTNKQNMQDASKKGRLKRSEQTCSKMSLAQIGHLVSKTARKKMSVAKIGNKNAIGNLARTGKPHSFATRMKMKKAQKVRRLKEKCS